MYSRNSGRSLGRDRRRARVLPRDFARAAARPRLRATDFTSGSFLLESRAPCVRIQDGSAMKIGVPRESGPGERRVAVVPDGIRQLKAAGAEILVETGAGAGSFHGDRAYADAGATVVSDPALLWSDADAILKIQPPLPHPALGRHEADLLRE